MKTPITANATNGSIIMGKVASKQMEKLDRVQYASIPTALGLIESTPINILLAESNELPLKRRRRWLATKYVGNAIRTKIPA
ncbi:hypothetical protein HHI36_011233 [Cryptolaemus montrouzieri]|uniref:Uncharacterized protein n=1 Tax=Cryptolaemus montrouzieri TaxID=559131 RepID=A0ABD2ML55_9CUCU